MIRGDLSNCLVHLTRGVDHAAAADAFLRIFRSKQLLGSSRDIRGGYKCVCFSEAPISVLAQALSLPPSQGMRYAPFGVMVRKEWLFSKGGRPAIYQPEAEFELLHEDIRFRHVRYDPVKGHDYAWEREWRIQTDQLHLDPAQVTFVIPNRAWEERFLDEHAGSQLGLTMMFRTDMPLSIGRSPWHFIALEDLGLQFTPEI
jgi:hypothetical protein